MVSSLLSPGNPSLLPSLSRLCSKYWRVWLSGSLAVFSLINICPALHQLRAQGSLVHTPHRSGLLHLLLLLLLGGEGHDGGDDGGDDDDGWRRKEITGGLLTLVRPCQHLVILTDIWSSGQHGSIQFCHFLLVLHKNKLAEMCGDYSENVR